MKNIRITVVHLLNIKIVSFMNSHSNKINQKIVLYDAFCTFCIQSAYQLKHLDSGCHLKIIPLQSAEGRNNLKFFNLPENYNKSVIFINENKYYLKSTAVIRAFSALGGIYNGFLVFLLIPPFLRDFVYTQISKMRYYYKNKSNCNECY